MKTLHIDFETFCELPIKECGLYRYVEHPSFRVLLFAFAWDDEKVRVVDCTQERTPGQFLLPSVLAGLTHPAVLKVAHNAAFEMEVLRKWLGLEIDPAQWRCTMVGAAYLGLPLALGKVAEVLGLKQQKEATGKALIRYFCQPCRPTKANGGRLRNLPEHAPDKWAQFIEYNRQDVATERAVFDYLQRFPGPPESEHAAWRLDQKINRTGITVDRAFIDAARRESAAFTERVHDELVKLTGVANPNSVAQLKAWVEGRLGYTVPSLGKDWIADALAGELLPLDVERVLQLRQLASRTSITKYDNFDDYACSDSRIRGLLQFYGANRTGRFAGRGPQIQNLKHTMHEGLEVARQAVLEGFTGLIYPDVSDVISRLTRTALVAAPGKLLVVSDFSAIEARVLAWLAGEEWVLEVFRTTGKIYEATAANMFGVPVESVTKGSDLRAKGKVATLALGYEGGVGALIAMGALREGLNEEELPGLVRSWRIANPHIVGLWAAVERSARRAIAGKTLYRLRLPHAELAFQYNAGYLFISLPSGRRLAYYGARIDKGRIAFYGMEQATSRWVGTTTYGGSLTENITQAVARDCLVDALTKIDKRLPILMHIHDEIVTEAPQDEAGEALEWMNGQMALPPSWGASLPLKGDGYVSKFYKKD